MGGGATTFRGMSAGEGAADRAETEMALYRRDCVVCPRPFERYFAP